MSAIAVSATETSLWADVIEKEPQRADRGDRTCYAFARVLRRAAVDRLEDRDLARVDVPRGGRAETSGECRAEIRDDVAEEIGRHDDVELLRLQDHPHGRRVDVHRLAPDIAELLAELLEDVAPDLLDRNGVRLVDESDVLLPVLSRELEGVADDPLDARPREAHRNARDLLRCTDGRALSFLRVCVFGVLADDRHVNLVRALSPERGQAIVVENDGAQVHVEVEAFA